MTDHEIDTLVAASNPVDEQALAALVGDDVLRDLGEAVMAGEPAGGRAAPAHSRWRPRRPPRRLLAAVALATIAAVAFLALSDRQPSDAGTAWAAPLVRLAESSPLLLIDDPQWRVVRADETSSVEGEMTFVRGSAPVDLTSSTYLGRAADLHWRHGSLAMWQRDRANGAVLVVRRSVLGHPAQISQYPEAQGRKDFTAIWPEDGRVLEFRAIARDLAAFEQLAGSLKRVGVDAWLSAMPASVVKAASRPEVVRAMLADIPLPPSFDSSKLEDGAILKDRYQLGAQVSGAVACEWIDRWDAARKRGDRVAEQQAEDAMRTARDWKILREMRDQGGWTQVLVAYADAMRGDGLWFGRPLKGDVQSGLGCASR